MKFKCKLRDLPFLKSVTIEWQDDTYTLTFSRCVLDENNMTHSFLTHTWKGNVFTHGSRVLFQNKDTDMHLYMLAEPCTYDDVTYNAILVAHKFEMSRVVHGWVN